MFPMDVHVSLYVWLQPATVIVGTGRGLNQLCGVEGVCGSCVWETGPPLFSYIVSLLLQTVNSTKDAQAIVGKTAEEEGGWGGC